MTAKIRQNSTNPREELSALTFSGAVKKKVFLDNLVKNGDFSVGLSASAHDGWAETANPTSVTIGGGGVTIVTTSYQGVEQYVPVTIGKTYKVTLDVTALNPNDAADRGRVYLGVAGDSDFYRNVNTLQIGTHSFYVTAAQDLLRIRLATKIQAGQATFDNVSVQEFGENLVTNGTFDSSHAWTQFDSGATVSGGALNLDGTPNADVCRQLNIGLVEGRTYHLSWEIESISAGEIGLKLGASTIHTSGQTGVHTATAVATATDNIQIYATGNAVGTVTNIRVIEGSHPVVQELPNSLDVSRVFINGELAREGENYDYQIKTDGINQWLKPTVEPTATTETAVIGVYK